MTLRLASGARLQATVSGDWILIDDALQDLELIKNELCSDNFKEKVLTKLIENFDSETV